MSFANFMIFFFSVEKKGRHGQESQKGRRTVRQIHNQNHTCEIYENGRYSVLTHNIWGKNIGRTTKNQSSVPFLKSQAEPLKNSDNFYVTNL